MGVVHWLSKAMEKHGADPKDAAREFYRHGGGGWDAVGEGKYCTGTVVAALNCLCCTGGRLIEGKQQVYIVLYLVYFYFRSLPRPVLVNSSGSQIALPCTSSAWRSR